MNKMIKQDLLKRAPMEPSPLNLSTSDSPATRGECPLVQEGFPHHRRRWVLYHPIPPAFIVHSFSIWHLLLNIVTNLSFTNSLRKNRSLVVAQPCDFQREPWSLLAGFKCSSAPSQLRHIGQTHSLRPELIICVPRENGVDNTST